MKMERAISAAASRLARVDVEAAGASLAEHKAEAVRLTSALEQARNEQMAVNRQLHERRRGPNPAKAADAMLAGGDVLEAEPSESDLEARKAALLAGTGELAERERRNRAELVDLRAAVARQLAEAVDPVADALQAEAAELTARLAQVFADAVALEQATASPGAGRLRVALADPLARLALRGRIVPESKLRPSAEVANLLDVHAAGVELAGRAAPDQVSFPQMQLQVSLPEPAAEPKAPRKR